MLLPFPPFSDTTANVECEFRFNEMSIPWIIIQRKIPRNWNWIQRNVVLLFVMSLLVCQVCRRQAESDADMTYGDFYVPSENSSEISSNESDTDL